ncbi:MAG: CDC48 family AAA ATPase [Candidatus Woesearchaeota archaeon]|nr:MAG: CDC48 family AAA ATPase [Candidatus Woesearchaeota archaeon]
MENKRFRLKVAEAEQEDVNKGIVRLDREVLKELKINEGDVVELEGERKTGAIAARAFPRDIGLGIIRMDGLTRKNAGIGVGERVTVVAIEKKEAKQITLAPAQKGISVQMNPETAKNALRNRILTKGDILSLGGVQRRSSAGGPFDDLFKEMEMGFGGLGNFGFRDIKFVVVNTNPAGSVVIGPITNIVVNPKAVHIGEERIPEVAYEDIGGLKEETKKVREMIEVPLKHPEIFKRLGIVPPKGVLLYGPPGTGKTLLAKAVANESEANFISINGPEIMSKFVGEAEKKLRQLFEDAEKGAPSIVFIDELDAIAPKREESYGEVERRVVAQLLALMDGLKGRGKVIVIGATNRPNALDPALRRGGRFDREVEIGVPNQKGRLEILKIHTRNMPLAKDVNLKEFAAVTHGFVGADLEGLCKEAAMNVIRRLLPKFKFEDYEHIPKEVLEKLIVNRADFKQGLKLVRPSGMREIFIETPKVKWEDIGGLEDVKQELKEAVEWPLKNPEVFDRMGIKAPRGIFLYGPPGCGKTLLAKAVANESEANFISIKGPELLSKWVGESEKAVREIFKKARQVSPTIVLFDEVDALVPKRGAVNEGTMVGERVVDQILSEIDGLEELADVVVIAATNRPDLIDPALIRGGRLDRHILVTAPDEKAREVILKIHTKNMPLDKDINIKDLAKEMINFSGADIETTAREAAMLALREDMKANKVSLKQFRKAMQKISPSVSENVKGTYDDMLAKKIKASSAPDYMG